MNHQGNAEILRAEPGKPKRSFYLSWIVLTSLCVPIAFILSFMVLKIIINILGDYVYVNGVRHITEDYLLMYVFVPIVSALTGVFQYWLLRQYLPRMGWWAFATVTGWFLGALLIALPGWLGGTDKSLNNLNLIFIIMGLAIGTAQWTLLRHKVAQTGWWIAANILGWGVLGLITGDTLNQYGLVFLGLLPACATAIALALQINRFSSTKPSS